MWIVTTITIIMYINNINSTINNNYGSLQDLNLFFKINTGMQKKNSKFVDKLGTRPQKGSPALSEVEEGGTATAIVISALDG